MITKKHISKSTLAVPNAVFVVSKITRSNNSASEEILNRVLKDEKSQTYMYEIGSNETENSLVRFQVTVFASVEAFNSGVMSVEEYTPTSGNRFNPNDYEGETIREKAYKHLLSLDYFSDATIVEGQTL